MKNIDLDICVETFEPFLISFSSENEGGEYQLLCENGGVIELSTPEKRAIIVGVSAIPKLIEMLQRAQKELE